MHRRVRQRVRHGRGIALADFIAGMMIFSAVMVVFTDLTRSKFNLISATEMHQRGQGAAEEALDRLRLEGLPSRPGKDVKADAQGFRQVTEFVLDKAHRLPEAKGEIAVRSLRMAAGDGHMLYEARVSISWRDTTGRSSLSITTVLPRPTGGGK